MHTGILKIVNFNAKHAQNIYNLARAEVKISYAEVQPEEQIRKKAAQQGLRYAK